MNSPIVPNVKKILIVRMLTSADVLAIALPAIRFFQQTLPDAEIHFLSFAEGAHLVAAAEPNIHLHTLDKDQWPDDFFQALEAFLGLAEHIVAEEYAQIVNLDTAFMPCFLNRFLKDAGEPINGNYLNMSIQELLAKFQDKSLAPEYVNNAHAYLDSSYQGMYKWFTPWWQSGDVPDGGYPEFYLKQCCGLGIDELQTSMDIVADKRLAKKAKTQKVIGLCLQQSEDGYVYPYTDELKKLLQQQGYHVWSEADTGGQLNTLLKLLKASDLMICKPSPSRWYAQAADCPVLFITGTGEPLVSMPDFATDPVSPCKRHSADNTQILPEKLECNCDSPQELVESIDSVFEHLAQEQKDA